MFSLRFTSLLLLLLSTNVQAIPTVPARRQNGLIRRQNDNAQSVVKSKGFPQKWDGYLCLDGCRETFGWAGFHFSPNSWGNVLLLGDPLVPAQRPNGPQSPDTNGDKPTTRTSTGTRTAVNSDSPTRQSDE